MGWPWDRRGTRSAAYCGHHRREEESERTDHHGSHRGQRADRGNGNEGGDQGVFDGGDAGLVLDDPGQYFAAHDDLLVRLRVFPNTVDKY